MRRIEKFDLQTMPQQDVHMPAGARIIAVMPCGEMPCIWAEVDDTKPDTIRTIEMFFTEQELPEDAFRKHLGSVQITKGQLALHVYERLAA